MKVSAVYCSKCDTLVYSRARHDFRWCLCKSVAVDGGFDYLKVSFDPNVPYSIHKYEVNHTKEELFNDWTLEQNKYGLIKSPDKTKMTVINQEK